MSASFLLIASSGWSSGPKYVGAANPLQSGTTGQYQHGKLNDFHSQVYNEFVNAYNDIKNLPSGTYLTSTMTLYGINATSGTIIGLQGSTITYSSATFTNLTVTNLTGGPGRFLQIASTTTVNVQKTTTSATYATTQLQGLFTLQKATSKVLVIAAQSVGTNSIGTSCTFRLRRDSTDLTTMANDQAGYIGNVATEGDAMISMLAIDSPGDTNQHTYSVVFSRIAGSGTCIANSTLGSGGGNGGGMLMMEISQ